MKKVLFLVLMGSSISSTSFSYSQKLHDSGLTRYSEPRQVIMPPEKFNEEGGDHSLSLNEVSAKAMRGFLKNHKDVTDVKWFRTLNGMTAAIFTSNGIRMFEYYDKNGDFEYSLHYYKEDKLPRDVRHVVRSRFYDFSIYQVTEVKRNNKIAYLIKLEDKAIWKTIKVVDGEIEEIDELIKR